MEEKMITIPYSQFWDLVEERAQLKAIKSVVESSAVYLDKKAVRSILGIKQKSEENDGGEYTGI